MERQLVKRGIADPQAWLGAPGRNLDASLAEAVTLAVDDVVLGELLGQLAQTPLASDLVVGASVYRHPVDATALAWQVGAEVEMPADPDRRARMQRVQDAYQAAQEREGGEVSPVSLGLTPEEVAQYEADVAAELAAPLRVPSGMETAVAAAATAGLVSPVVRGDQALFFVHRWTARAIAGREPAAVQTAHAKAARFWQWRVARVPQSREQAIEQLIEARFHLRAGGNTAEGVSLTWPIADELETQGYYARAAELCRETLGWVDERSREAGDLHRRLGTLAHRRGDFAVAEARYGQAISLFEATGDEGGAAVSHANLAILAGARGDYDAAEAGYLRALAIHERIGDDYNVANSYNNLGNLARIRGDYDTAEARHRQSLEVRERLRDEAGAATSYGNLGTLAQLRSDYAAAEALYRQSLEIHARRGDQAGIATTYNYLGTLAQLRGDYETAEAGFRQSLEIQERVGNQAGAATSYMNLGNMALFRSDYETAEARYLQSLGIQESLGDQSGAAANQGNLGLLAVNRGDYDTAEARYRQSLHTQERLGEQVGMAANHGNLGNLARSRGDYDTAEARYRQSLQIQERLGDQAGMATNYGNLGILAQLRGDDAAAEAHYRQSLEIQEHLGDHAGMATTFSSLAGLYVHWRQDERAVHMHVTALSIRIRLGVPDAARNLARLSELKTSLGPEAFAKTLAESLDEENRTNLLALLERYSKPSDPGQAK